MSRRRRRRGGKSTHPLTETTSKPVVPPVPVQSSEKMQEAAYVRGGSKKPKKKPKKPGQSAPVQPNSNSSFLHFSPANPDADPRDLASLINYGGQSQVAYLNAWTDNRIEQSRAFKHWTFIAIDAIAKRVACQIPNVSYVHTDDIEEESRKRKPKLLGRYYRNKALLPLLTHEQLEPVAHSHPLLRVLKDPNDQDTSYDFVYETIMFLFLTGSAYWYVPRNALGVPVALHVIPSHWVWPVMGSTTWIDGWELRPVEGNYLRKYLPAEHVIQVRFKNPYNKVDGFSRLTAVARWADVQDSMDLSMLQSFRNGTFPTVSVMFDSKVSDPSPEDLQRIEAKFYSRYNGPLRSNKPLFLPPGVKVAPLVIKPSEFMFGENRDQMRDNILAAFGVPAPVVCVGNQSSASALSAMTSFYAGTINPLCKFLGQTITQRLAVPLDETLRVWWEDSSPEDPEMIEKRLINDCMMGAITPNEARILRGREPFKEEWANKPIFPVNMTVGAPALGGVNNGKDHPNSRLEQEMPAPDTGRNDKRIPSHLFDYIHPSHLNGR